MMHSGLCVHLLRDGKQYNGNWKAAMALKQERLWPLWPKQNPIVKIAQMMRVFGGSIVWQHGEKKRSSLLSRLLCLWVTPARLHQYEWKKWRGKWKEMWLLHEGMWREEKKNGARGKKKGGSDTEKQFFVIQGTRKTGSKVYRVTCRLRWFTILLQRSSRESDTNTVCLSPQAADGHTLLDPYTASLLTHSSSV